MSDARITHLDDIAVAALVPHPRNYNRHSALQRERLSASLARFGQVRSIVVQASDDDSGRYLIVAGHGLVEAAQAHGQTHVHADVIPATWTSTQVEGYLIADNELARLSDPDTDVLAALLQAQQNGGADLASMGLAPEELTDWLARLEDSALTPTPNSVRPPDRKRFNGQRHVPLDMIYTVDGGGGLCCLAVRAGLRYGIQSAATGGDVCAYALRPSPRNAHRVLFVDNDYRAYDHALHTQVVARLRPKYATTRDIMTRQQCVAAGIDYYPLEQILAWAEELEQHAQRVILIPKYDCLDRIPARYVLGYSIPTSHGGTPLPVEMFRGRPVHLLGGSWDKQLTYLAALAEDVVSIDNNHVHRIASFGQFVTPDGQTHQLADLAPFVSHVTNPLYICLAISFGAMSAAVRELFGLPVTGGDGDVSEDVSEDEDYDEETRA